MAPGCTQESWVLQRPPPSTHPGNSWSNTGDGGPERRDSQVRDARGSEQADRSWAARLGLHPSLPPHPLGAGDRGEGALPPRKWQHESQSQPTPLRKPASAECTREEDWAPEADAYEKYKENGMRQTGSDRAGVPARRGLRVHGSLCPQGPDRALGARTWPGSAVGVPGVQVPSCVQSAQVMGSRHLALDRRQAER